MVFKTFIFICIFCAVHLHAQKVTLSAQYIKDGQYKLLLKNNTSKSVTLYVDLNGFGYGDRYNSYFSEEYFLQLNMFFLDKLPADTDFPIGADVSQNIEYGGKYKDLSKYLESCKLIFKPYETKQRYVYLYDTNRIFMNLPEKEFKSQVYLKLPTTSIREYLLKKQVADSVIKNIHLLKSDTFNAKIRLMQWSRNFTDDDAN